MRRVTGMMLAALVVVLCGAGRTRAGALRALAVDGNTCWAAGDGGTILRSGDAGLNWQVVDPPVKGHFQAVQIVRGEAYFYGGLSVVGDPTGQGVGVILRTADAGRSFQAVPPGPTGWLYGGCFAGPTGVVYGQANYLSTAGIWHTIDGGKFWHCSSVTSEGFLLAGDFHTPRYGYMVGGRLRMVSFRNLAEPYFHPPPVRSPQALRAAAFADEKTCWAVGDNAAVYRSSPSATPWTAISLAMNPEAVRGADLEAIAFGSPKQAWLAGGLIGVLPYTESGGGRWRFLPAPGPGAIHALAHVAGQTILAAGDGRRIWRSEDGGKRWRLVSGPDRTDVLFVLAAGDRSVQTAVVAHARAGDSVAVVFATRLRTQGALPGDQPLRAAAAECGADGIATLSEFPSVFGDPASATLSADEIGRRWSVGLDIHAEPEMVRQLAAAIRLYRPSVLAVGPDGAGHRGVLAENHLVARLAQVAATRAADANALPGLAKTGLAPWKVQRVFVGFEANERWAAPWQPPQRPDRAAVAAAFAGEKFPNAGRRSLELLAARALWRLPQTGLLDRTGSAGAYRCEGVDKPIRLFTSGLGSGRLLLSSGEAGDWLLTTAGRIRAAIATDSTYAAAADLVARLRKASDDPAAAELAADRLLLCWWRLLDEGKLIEADHVLGDFLKDGSHHPLYRRINVLALAASTSAEWQALLAARGLGRAMKPAMLQRAAENFPKWVPWSIGPAGRMLHARTLTAAGQFPPARSVLVNLAREPYPPAWRSCAMLELGDPAALAGRRHVEAAFVTERGAFDGLLNEACWKEARPRALRPYVAILDPRLGGDRDSPRDRGPGGPPPELQVVRSVGDFVLFAVRLPRALGRQWDLEIAIDADRDTWTQMVVECDTAGASSGRLLFRDGPAAKLDGQAWQVRGQRGPKEWTFEIAVPLRALSAKRQKAAELWNLQVRATAHDRTTRTIYYYQDQPDRRLLPERYGLLKVPFVASPEKSQNQ